MGSAIHQYLHLDSREYDNNNLYKNLIVHIPIETEEMALQLAKLHIGGENEKSKLCHEFIHIQFGSGVILSSNQLHAGHYGKKASFDSMQLLEIYIGKE